jgi:hypothetical protein
VTVAAVAGALSIGIIGFYSGKNPDGSAKTEVQVSTANQIAAETKDIPAVK